MALLANTNAGGDNGKIMTDPVALREMLLEAGKSEADVGKDQKVIVRLAHSHLADLSSQYVKWAIACRARITNGAHIDSHGPSEKKETNA